MDVLIILIMVIKIHNPFYPICVCVYIHLIVYFKYLQFYLSNIHNSVYQIFTIIFIKYSSIKSSLRCALMKLYCKTTPFDLVGILQVFSEVNCTLGLYTNVNRRPKKSSIPHHKLTNLQLKLFIHKDISTCTLSKFKSNNTVTTITESK